MSATELNYLLSNKQHYDDRHPADIYVNEQDDDLRYLEGK